MAGPLKLADLEPELLVAGDNKGNSYRKTDSLEEAQGVWFQCPACYVRNGGPVGTHYVLCWFRDRGVPDNWDPRPGRWAPSGSGLADLTLSPSVHLSGPGCGWHGFVQAGKVTIL